MLLHHLFSAICHEKNEGSPGPPPFLVVVENVSERRVIESRLAYFLLYYFFQLHSFLALIDELILKLCELRLLSLPATLIFSAEPHEIFEGVGYSVSKLTDLN